MEPSGFEPLTPCMPLRRLRARDPLLGQDLSLIVTNYVRRSVRRSVRRFVLPLESIAVLGALGRRL